MSTTLVFLFQGMFLNGRSEKMAKQKLTDPTIEKVWPPLPENREFEGK